MDKATMIKQGYVPATCVMHEGVAGLLIFSEVSAGRDPCTGCNAGGDRKVCGGRPRGDAQMDAYHSKLRMEEMALQKRMTDFLLDKPINHDDRWEREAKMHDEQRARDRESELISGPLHSPFEEIK